MEIINLGHACFMFKGNNFSFVVDPYQDNSVPNLTMPRVSVNYVFKSHEHSDHNALNLVRIEPTNAELKHEEIVVPHDHHNGEHRGLNKIHIFYVDGLKIIHTGDLGCIPNQDVLAKMKDADILLAPINGHFTISSFELAEILKLIKPRLVVPMHYHKTSRNSGYPDGGQIDVFKRLVPSYLEVNDYKADITEDLFKYDALIFDKELQEVSR